MAKNRIPRKLVRAYKPVPFDEEKWERRLQTDPEFKAAYDALEEEFTALDAELTARAQAEEAERMRTAAAASTVA
jgi:hypothetical protein